MSDLEYKQIILIRTDVDMRCGKKCVQVAHASTMGCELAQDNIVEAWKREGMRKIVLKVQTLDQMMNIANCALAENISHVLVRDFGLTQLEPNTITALGFAPYHQNDPEYEILSNLTKELSLL